MTTSFPSLTTRSLTVPVDLLVGLRRLAQADAGPALVTGLRDAGYAAGHALFDQFGHWLADRGERPVELLPEDRFAGLASEFLSAQGWGTLQITALSDAVMAVDSEDWAEAAPGDGDDVPAAGPCCHVSTGLLAGFFGRVADAPLAVLEVECRAAGGERCRFLVGSIDVLGYVHEAMGRGIPYDRAAASA